MAKAAKEDVTTITWILSPSGVNRQPLEAQRI